MVVARARLTLPNGDVLGRAMTDRCRRLADAEAAARTTAAQTATNATRKAFTYHRAVDVPARKGRDHPPGAMLAGLRWTTSSAGGVDFDIAEADRVAPYWIIQEIGTGQKATIKRGGDPNPRGRAPAGNTYIRTVRSAIGRRIPANLVWATGAGGHYEPPGAGQGQQLYLRATVRGAPIWEGRAKDLMYITREVEGQHFVQKGGRVGFTEYRNSVLGAARKIFAGYKYTP